MQTLNVQEIDQVSGGDGVTAAAVGIGAVTALGAAALAGATVATGGVALLVYGGAFFLTHVILSD